MKNSKIAILITMITLISILLAGCGESWEREKKKMKSEYGGGIERVVEVMNINGEVVQKYEGKFDIEAEEGKIKFIKDGKLIIIYRSQTDSIMVTEK